MHMYFGKNEFCKNRSTSNWQGTYSFWNLTEYICKPSAWLLSTCGWVLIWHQGEKGLICGRKYKAVLTQAPKGYPKCCPNTWKRTKSPIIEQSFFWCPQLVMMMISEWFTTSNGITLSCCLSGFSQTLKKIWQLVSYLDSGFCWLCGDGLGGLEMVESFVE